MKKTILEFLLLGIDYNDFCNIEFHRKKVTLLTEFSAKIIKKYRHLGAFRQYFNSDEIWYKLEYKNIEIILFPILRDV
jgi:hypothetical protein